MRSIFEGHDHSLKNNKVPEEKEEEEEEASTSEQERGFTNQ